MSDLAVTILLGLQSITVPGQPTSTVPVLQITTTSPFSSAAGSLKLGLGLRLEGAPSKDGSQRNLISDGALAFKKLELGLSLRKPIGDSMRFSPQVECGTSTRLGEGAEQEPPQRWCGAGVVFDRTSRGVLTLAAGWDERLGGGFRPVLSVGGYLDLGTDVGPLAGYLFGRVIAGRGGKLRAEVGIGVAR